MNRSSRRSQIAGIAAGLCALIVFLLLHAFWILPIWFVLPVGVLIAGAGGAAIGAAYHELLRGLPAARWIRMMVVYVSMLGVLAPAFVLAQLRDPIFAVTGRSAVLARPVSVAVLLFLLELLATAAVAGALAGWFIGRTRRAAGLTALAALGLALGPGHNIPLVGGTPGVPMEARIMAPVLAVAAITLVLTEAALRSE